MLYIHMQPLGATKLSNASESKLDELVAGGHVIGHVNYVTLLNWVSMFTPDFISFSLPVTIGLLS